MIYERRAYTFRPGGLEKFWSAQPTWNADDVFGEIRAANISYFQLDSTEVERIVHLYRFDSLNAWRDTYERYYAAQNPEYFALVRPTMLAQENAFLIAAPGREGLVKWADPTFTIRSLIGDAIGNEDLGEVVVSEEELQLRPGGLPAYWQAYGELRFERDRSADSNLIAVHQALVGRLHRVFCYRWFRSLDAAKAFEEARGEDPVERAFKAAYGAFLETEAISHLRPAPLARLRALFGF